MTRIRKTPLLHESAKLFLVLCAVLAVCSAVHVHGVGELAQGRFEMGTDLYVVERAARNPHYQAAIFDGNCIRGSISITLADPVGLCVTTDCGHNAQYSLFKIAVRHGKVVLDEVVENPLNLSPAPYGVVNAAAVDGACVDDEATFSLQFELFITNTSNPNRTELVDTFNSASYRLKTHRVPGFESDGSLTRRRRYTTGESYGFSVPWSSLLAANGIANPYQYLSTESKVDSRFPMLPYTQPPYTSGLEVKNLLRAHRIVSPYGIANRPFFNPSSLKTSGTLSDTSIQSNGVISGFASLRTGAQAAYLGNDTLPGLGNLVLEHVPFEGHYVRLAHQKSALISYAYLTEATHSDVFYVLLNARFWSAHL